MLCTRDDVKPAREEDFRTGYTGGHLSKAPVQFCDSCKEEKLHRMNR